MSDGKTEAMRGTYFHYTYGSTPPSIDYNTNGVEHVTTNGVEHVTTNQWQEPHIEFLHKHTPDPKWHKIVSFIKSGFRIVGYCFIPFSLVTATIILILSEIIGIVEEMV
jgi:hypothetical protein